jgi:hypothetical protein
MYDVNIGSLYDLIYNIDDFSLRDSILDELDSIACKTISNLNSVAYLVSHDIDRTVITFKIKKIKQDLFFDGDEDNEDYGRKKRVEKLVKNVDDCYIRLGDVIDCLKANTSVHCAIEDMKLSLIDFSEEDE